MANHFQALYQYRELLAMLVVRDLRIRYKQTVLGFAWALVLPAAIVGAGIVIRLILNRGSGLVSADVAAVVVKSLPWAFFTAALKGATNSLIGNKNLVAKVAFPKEVFPIAALAVSLVDMLIAVAVAGLILAFLVPDWTWWALFAPVPVIIILLLTLGAGLILAALNLFFRDVKYIVDVVLTFAIFFTPVVYDAAMLGSYAGLVMLNPIAPPLEALSDVVVHGRAPQWGWLAYSAAVALVAVALGYRVFKNLEYKFAESV